MRSNGSVFVACHSWAARCLVYVTTYFVLHISYAVSFTFSLALITHFLLFHRQQLDGEGGFFLNQSDHQRIVFPPA